MKLAIVKCAVFARHTCKHIPIPILFRFPIYTVYKWHAEDMIYTEKSYKRPPHIFSSSSESKIRSIKIHDHMNKPMSNSGYVSFCIPKCVILLTQTKHV